jgi:cytosine/adenosine deaminase-related metal-dependent hydrolase
MPVIYSSRWVLPITSGLIEDGAVAVDGSKILGIGTRADITSRFPDSPMEDFGQAAILPGLINAHSHLELTVMRGFLESKEGNFFAWLQKLTVARMTMTPEDLLASATCGAIEAARAGITCMADASSAGIEAMKALRLAGLRGIVYQESFGPDPELAAENVANLREQISSMREHENDLVRAGVSPHAPYTVSAPQLELIARLAIEESLPVMMHVAESQAEKSFMLEGRGLFAERLRARAIDWQAPGISTIQYLARHGILETRPLLAHCINVDHDDLDLIRQSAAGIAHCPKSNAKLGHGRAPFADFIAQRLNVGLGSDSVASNNTCDLLEEARFATLLSRLPSAIDDPGGRLLPSITAEQALFAATLGGARALGLDNQIGALAEGLQADITIVSLNGVHQQPVNNPSDALVFSSSGRDVVLTMVAGKEICRAGRVKGLDEDKSRSRLETLHSSISVR